MSEPIRAELITLDADLGADKEHVVHALTGMIADACEGADASRIAADVLAREQAGATGLPNGLAIPHCRSAGATETALAFARLSRPVDFGSRDGRPADMILLLAHPAEDREAHLQMLSRLTRSLVKPMFVDALRDARSTDVVAALLREAVGLR